MIKMRKQKFEMIQSNYRVYTSFHRVHVLLTDIFFEDWITISVMISAKDESIEQAT